MESLYYSTKHRETAIDVDMYRKWKEADVVIVVGFGFGTDDEHINGILRTIVNDDGKVLKVVTLKQDKSEKNEAREIARKLKISDYRKIHMLLVDQAGKRRKILDRMADIRYMKISG